MKRYFITGTDTDCGKTYVTSQLLQALPAAAALKPVASGCFLRGEELVSSDAEQLQQYCGLSLDQINPWRYRLPASPHIAAEREGTIIDVKSVADYCLNFTAPGKEYLFIEGAGGLMAPLTYQQTWIDFLKLTQFSVILVVGLRLGCLNHALLTASVLSQHYLACTGWIANVVDPNYLAVEENIDTLNELLPFPLLTTITYQSNDCILINTL